MTSLDVTSHGQNQIERESTRNTCTVTTSVALFLLIEVCFCFHIIVSILAFYKKFAL